jgi:hypothetical protein
VHAGNAKSCGEGEEAILHVIERIVARSASELTSRRHMRMRGFRTALGRRPDFLGPLYLGPGVHVNDSDGIAFGARTTDRATAY